MSFLQDVSKQTLGGSMGIREAIDEMLA